MVEELLDEAECTVDPFIDEERQHRIAAAEEGLKILPDFVRRVTADTHPEWRQLDDDQLLERVREEHEQSGCGHIWNRFESNEELHEYIAYERALEKGWIASGETNDSEEEQDRYAVWHEIAERMKNG